MLVTKTKKVDLKSKNNKFSFKRNEVGLIVITLKRTQSMTQRTKTPSRILLVGPLEINWIKLKLQACRNFNSPTEAIETLVVGQNLAYRRVIIVRGKRKRSHACKNNLTALLCQSRNETHFLIRDLTKEMRSPWIATAREDFRAKSLFSHTNLVIEKRVFPEDQLRIKKQMLVQNKNLVLSSPLWYARFHKARINHRCLRQFFIHLRLWRTTIVNHQF